MYSLIVLLFFFLVHPFFILLVFLFLFFYQDFKKLIQISPIHNVRIPKDGVQYPSMLLTTGDHDDRVVPLHTLKLLAELQYTIGGDAKQTNPILGRISVNEGHGAGKPTAKIIDEQADIYGFVLETTKVRSGSNGSKL
jgi:prolyl oligopeptidase